MEPARTVDRQSWRAGSASSGSRSIPEETAVAVTYNSGTYAVMMTTPQDLEDFALGFSLSEGVIDTAADIDSLEIVDLDDGVELRMWLSQPRADRLKERRRRMAGPTGCGLCGIESIAEAMRPTATIGHGGQFSPEQIMAAMEGLPSRQRLNIETRAVHAAAFWTVTGGIVALREDVGRHNALDKLSGALARASIVAREGIRTSHQPGIGGDGAENRRDWSARDGVGFGSDRAGRSYGGCSGYHTCRHRARGRIRSVHPSV